MSFGPQCAQGTNGEGSEDCLFLNIWTPYLPFLNGPGNSHGVSDKRNAHRDGGKNRGKRKLRPVGLWIHGGAFTGGTANDETFDGGNIVSRGDMVLVAMNYRVSGLGYLALSDGKTNGNFGLGDQINALNWVREHIDNFGGDPDRITVFGQSAGAASVRALLASPKATGKFAGAILMSNLGGMQYATTYSHYYTIDEQVNAVADPILRATNCSDAPSQVDCLRALPANLLTGGLPDIPVARFLVVDGTYLTGPELDLSSGAHPLSVNLMMGITREDGAAFITFPRTPMNKTEYLIARGFNATTEVPLVDEHLFPFPPEHSPTGNQTLDLFDSSTRFVTDGLFRCLNLATVNAGLRNGLFQPRHAKSGDKKGKVYYYEFDRTYQLTSWPGTDVCEAPHGDPARPYFRCHSGELYYVFGNLARQGLPQRSDNPGDLEFEQFVLDSWAAFIRTGDPNPEKGFLVARGYKSTLEQVWGDKERSERAGGARGWVPSTGSNDDDVELTMRVLDWPSSYQSGFREREQCKGLGLGLEYYL